MATPERKVVSGAGAGGAEAESPHIRQDMWGALGSMLQRHSHAPRLAPLARGGRLEISPAQERLWSLYESEPETAFYNIPLAWTARGRLDPALLGRALNSIAARHEILRTRFEAVDGRVCAVVRETAEWPLEVGDLRGLPAAARHAEAVRRACEYARRPFDLRRGPLMRAALFRIADGEHLLLIAVHQIVFDGASMRVLSGELADWYRSLADDTPLALPPLPVQYLDFAGWQRESLKGQSFEGALAYWQERMRPEYKSLRLPLDRARLPAPGSAPAARCAFQFPKELTGRLAGLGREHHATLFTVLLAGLQALLARYSGQQDVMVFASVAGRSKAELRNLIGLIANVIPFRTDLAGCLTFSDLLGRVREVTLGGFANQDVPFENVMGMLRVASGARAVPASQVMMIFQNAALPEVNLPGVTLTPCHEVDNGAAKFDLLFEVTDTPEGLRGWLKYRADLFEPATVARIVQNYREVLASVAEAPGRPLAELLPGMPEPGEPAAVAAEACNGRPPYVQPRSNLERQLAQIWEDVLRVRPVGIHDNYFDLGGTSLMAVRVFARIAKATGRTLRLATLIAAPTVAGLAALLESGGERGDSSLVLLRPDGAGTPLFFVPGVGGRVLELRSLARHMPGQRFFGFEARDLDEFQNSRFRIEDIARQCVRDMRAAQPRGPYYLGGVCFGAFVALEMAHQLDEMGERVAFLALLDPPAPSNSKLSWRDVAALARVHMRRLLRMRPRQIFAYLAHTAREQARAAAYRVLGAFQRAVYNALRATPGLSRRVLGTPSMTDLRNRLQKAARAGALSTYAPRPYGGDFLLLQTQENGMLRNMASEHGWRAVAPGGIEVRILPASHSNFVYEPYVAVTAERVREYLDARRAKFAACEPSCRVNAAEG